MENLENKKGSTKTITPISHTESGVAPEHASVNVGTKYRAENEVEEGGFIDKPIKPYTETVDQPKALQIDQDNTEQKTVLLAIKILVALIGTMLILYGVWGFLHPIRNIPQAANHFIAATTIIFGIGLFFRKEVIRKVIVFLSCISILVLLGLIAWLMLFKNFHHISDETRLSLLTTGVVILVLNIIFVTIVSVKQVKQAFS